MRRNIDALESLPNLPSLHSRNATQCHVSNVSVKSSNEHELLPVECNVNGRRAVMLIDSDSTHDFNAEGFEGSINYLRMSVEERIVRLPWPRARSNHIVWKQLNS